MFSYQILVHVQHQFLNSVMYRRESLIKFSCRLRDTIVYLYLGFFRDVVRHCVPFISNISKNRLSFMILSYRRF